MGFPDRIERTIEIASPPAAVWDAITTAEGLASWFGQEVSIDLRPGGAFRMSWDGGHVAQMRVERVERPEVFGYTWRLDGLPEDDARRTYVEFTLEARDGGTRLRVVETGFAQLPDDMRVTEYDAHTKGWAAELDELVDHLAAA